MANYNTFVVMDCKKRRLDLVTSSAKKAGSMLSQGKKVEVWNNNELSLTIYSRSRNKLDPFVSAERRYIAEKQKIAELRNRKRR